MIERLQLQLADRLAPLGLAPDEILLRDAPGGLADPGMVSANRHCHLLPTVDGWVVLNLARDEDRELVPAMIGSACDDAWRGAARAALATTAADFRDRALELQLPVAVLGESPPQSLSENRATVQAAPHRVLDLSALWAGPLCASLLARAGAEVVRIESIGRPDPTPVSSPRLDAWLNGSKRRVPLDLRTSEGRAELMTELERADVVVTSARPAALERLGLSAERLKRKTWVAITAHGAVGCGALRVGFGDDCAVAGGLVAWVDGAPRFMGDALADPLTGVEAALAVLGGGRGLIDMAMSRVASAYNRSVS